MPFLASLFAPVAALAWPLMVLGGLAAGCLAIAAGLLVQMHVLAAGVNPIEDPVSLYGTTQIDRRYRMMVVALGASAILLAAGLARETDARHLVWLWVFGACRLAIAGFMMDRDERSPSIEGRLHLLLAVVAFTAIALAGARITWAGAPAALHPAGEAIVAATLATLIARFSPQKVFGLAERLIYLTAIVWIAIAAASLIGGS